MTELRPVVSEPPVAGGLDVDLLGSVPANISHRAACDVLIVHTTGRGARS